MENLSRPDGLNPISAAFSELSSSKHLDRLDRYEGRLSRMYQRAHHNILQARTLEDMLPEPKSDAPRLDPKASEAAPEIPVEQNEPNSSPAATNHRTEIAPQPNEPKSPPAVKPERDPLHTRFSAPLHPIMQAHPRTCIPHPRINLNKRA